MISSLEEVAGETEEFPEETESKRYELTVPEQTGISSSLNASEDYVIIEDDETQTIQQETPVEQGRSSPIFQVYRFT